MADAALTHQRLVGHDILHDRVAGKPDEKWPMRKTLIFVVGSSTALWAGIIYAAWSVL